MALDTVLPTLTQLRDEHARLHAAIGQQPRDPARALNDNASDLQRAEEGLEAAGARRRGLEERLDTMRGVRRLTHRDERAELEDVLHQTYAREADLAVDVAQVETARDELTDEHDRYASWKREHAPQL